MSDLTNHLERKAAMICITRDEVEVMMLTDKVVVLNGGRIEQVGSPLELYQHPVNSFAADFGDRAGLTPDLAHCHLFDTDGSAVSNKPRASACAPMKNTA